MSHLHRNRRRSISAAILVALLAGVVLGGCGGSSKSASTSASTATAANGKRAQFGARSAALRSCLQKNGITLPSRKPGQHGGPFTGGAGQPPGGVTRTKLQAALKKCGGGNFPRGGRGFGGTAAKQRYTRFAACMRKNGVSLPVPNTSGKGPIFNTKGIDTTGGVFKAADAKCVRELAPAGGGARPGAAGAGAPGAPQVGQAAGPPPGQ